MCFLVVIAVFCLIRQLRSLSNNSGNRIAIVEVWSRTIICSRTTLHRCAHEQNYSWEVVRRSRGEFSASENEEKNASNDNLFYSPESVHVSPDRVDGKQNYS